MVADLHFKHNPEPSCRMVKTKGIFEELKPFGKCDGDTEGAAIMVLWIGKGKRFLDDALQFAAGASHGHSKSHVFHRSGCRYYNCEHCAVLFKGGRKLSWLGIGLLECVSREM